MVAEWLRSVVFIFIDVHTILQCQGRCFLEELYSELVPTIKNIFGDIDVKDDWQTYLVLHNNYEIDMMKLITYFI